MNRRKTQIEALQIGLAARANKGMTLAGVLAVGTIVALFASALFTTVLGSYQKVASLKHSHRVRALAEIGMDYAVQQLNAKASGFDPGNTIGSSVSKTVPSSLLNGSSGTVTVRISNPGNPPNTSMLFDPLLNVASPNSFRMATVTANFGATTKQVRALLQPITASPLTPQMPYGLFGIASVVYAGQSGISTYNKRSFQLLGADGGSLGKISQVWSRSGGLARGIAQGGSHYEYPNPQSYYNQQFNIVGQNYGAQATSSAPWMQMMGNVYSNGVNTAYFERTGAADLNASHNVFGASNGLQSGVPEGHSNQTIPVGTPPTWSGGQVNFNVEPSGSANVTYAQPTIPPAPPAPAGTQSLGNINLQNGAKLVIDASAPMPSGPIGTVKGKTVKIPPGDYKVNSVSLSGASSIEVASSTQSSINSGSQPATRMFLEGTSTPTTAVSISNDSSINMNGMTPNSGFNTQGKNGIPNGAASNQLAINKPGDSSLTNQIAESSGGASQLQLYSSAQTNFVLQGNERMVIYAPYANVTIGSLLSNGTSGEPIAISRDANFYGAAVAQNLMVQSSYSSGGGAFAHYDWRLRPNGMEYINPWAQVSPFQTGSLSGYRVVSWQEAITTNSSNPQQAQWYYK
ncbi:MAG: hypothetical protein K2X27_09570 [Candidatus Obscuribacterales bacterium]|nr:hypothetical protein [Candidatus Obscuribacterales bacterium]